MDYRMPIYLQIKAAIQEKIDNKEYLPGSAIPSERKLAELYGVNRMTVKNAINMLVDEGYLFRVHGKGTFVKKENSQKIVWGADQGSGLGASLNETGVSRKDKVLVKGLLKAFNYLGEKLKLKKYEDVYTIHRLRYANEEPFAVEYCYIPFKYFDDIDKHNFENESVYQYMESKDHYPVSFTDNLILVEADERLSKLMKIELGEPVYYFEFIGKDKEDNVVEYTESYINCKMATFSFEAKRDYKKKNMS